ncbi:MAG TPA: SCO family protein, partial [Candidatus Sulfopaludibacter sp.]|nr:SCO family protein [Candidatus Sulfopaludibacter sp.]
MRGSWRMSVFVVSAALLSAKTYPVDGIVVAVDPAARTMLVSHRPIAGYMPAMMMPFRVADPESLRDLYPGARVEFLLDVARDHAVARDVHRTGEPDAAIPPPRETLRIGDPLPGFHLTDQHGRDVEPADLHGKVAAIDFIYTRCPLPDVCPRLAASFAALARRFARDPDLLLLSVTVDPDYDTTAVLADYARRWSAGPNWRFLTGDVAPLAAHLGEVYWSDEGSIGHNSVTTIVNRAGRIAARVDGSQWRIEQLANLIARELKENP